MQFLIIALAIFTFNIGYAAPKPTDWWIADDYVKNASLQYKWGIQYIKRLPFKPNDKILDIGAGDGRLTAFIARKLPTVNVIGIDKSTSMISQAKQSFSPNAFPNLRFEHQSVDSMRFKNKFNWVISFSTLHWVKEIDKAFARIAMALKPKGHVFLYFAPDYGHDRFDHALDEVMKQPQWSEYFTSFQSDFNLITPTQILSLVESNGLFLDHMKIITVKETFSSKTEFKKWFAASLPQVHFLPKQYQERFMDQVIARYLEKRPNLLKHGKITFLDYWIEVEATKEI